MQSNKLSDMFIIFLFCICHPSTLKIVETNASELGYGGILKQHYDQHDHLVRYHSGIWNPTQAKYSTIKKEIEILSIVLCIMKFQDDLLNQIFLLCIDCV